MMKFFATTLNPAEVVFFAAITVAVGFAIYRSNQLNRPETHTPAKADCQYFITSSGCDAFNLEMEMRQTKALEELNERFKVMNENPTNSCNYPVVIHSGEP